MKFIVLSLMVATICSGCTSLENNPRLRYALGAALGSYSQQQAQQEAFRQQQVLMDSQKRTTTNCYMMGNQMTCNSY